MHTNKNMEDEENMQTQNTYKTTTKHKKIKQTTTKTTEQKSTKTHNKKQ